MILLDSQTLLWALLGNKRLGRFAGARIQSTEEVYFSAITLFEIEVKRLLGKFHPPKALREKVTSIGYVELPFQGKSVDELRAFPGLNRHDPFDRMILATAMDKGLTLLTSDTVLLSLGHPKIIDSQV